MSSVEVLNEKSSGAPLLFEFPNIRVFERESVTSFKSQKRFIALYLRSVWGCGFSLDTLPQVTQSRLLNGVLYFPEETSSQDVAANKSLYRAMALHISAHCVYGSNWSLANEELDPALRTLIGWVEDARVEQAAMHFSPRIEKQLREFVVPSSLSFDSDVESLLQQLQRAMFDKGYVLHDEALAAWVSHFHQVISFDWHNASVSVQLGRELYALISTRIDRIGLHRLLKKFQLPYRDDGVCLFGRGE